jgi:hypothetical protein
MRTILLFSMTLLVTVGLWAGARRAAASEAQRRLDEAKLALAAEPRQRDVARSALSAATAAGDDKQAVSAAYHLLGQLDEEDEAFARAVVDYRESLRASPVSAGAPWSRPASQRMQWLSLRSEGSFAPLTRLLRMKRDPALSSDPQAIEAFARDVEAMPPGIVRAESRLLVATAWLGPLHHVEDAVAVLRKAAGDAAGDGPSIFAAQHALVDALVADGQLGEAQKLAHQYGFDPEALARVDRLARRQRLTRAAAIVLAASFGLAAGALWYARRSGGWRALWTRMPVRIAAAILCATSAVAAAFLALGAFASTALERFRL